MLQIEGLNIRGKSILSKSTYRFNAIQAKPQQVWLLLLLWLCLYHKQTQPFSQQGRGHGQPDILSEGERGRG